MSDINIEDFIHETRSMQDDYDKADANDCMDDIWESGELREYLDRALTLARSYDKLLRELDVANATRQLPMLPPYAPGLTPPTYSPPWSHVGSGRPDLGGPINNGFPAVPGIGWPGGNRPTVPGAVLHPTDDKSAESPFGPASADY